MSARSSRPLTYLVFALVACGGSIAQGDAPLPEVARLVAALDDADVRYGASLALVRLGKQAVPSLSKSLTSSRPDQRVWAAYTLGEIGPDAASAVGDLTQSLSHSDPSLRAAAAQALGKLGAAAASSVKSLAQLLSDEQLIVRQRSIVALGQIGPAAQAVDEQLTAAMRDSRTRSAARLALVQIGSAVSPTVEAALGEDELRFDATLILRQIDPEAASRAGVHQASTKDLASLRLVLWDQTRPASEQAHAAADLATLGDVGISLLIKAFETPEIAATAAGAFSKTGEAGVNSLIKALAHEQAAVRAVAADALAHIGQSCQQAAATSAAVEALARLLNDQDHEVRYRAVLALDAFGELAAPAVPDLVKVILDATQHEPTRQWAIMAIVNTVSVRHEEVVAALIKANQDASNYGVRSLAGQQVRKLDPEAAKAAGVR